MRWYLLVGFVVAAIGYSASAQVLQFTNEGSWQTAVGGQYSTIDFTGFPDGTQISNQYQPLGITFSGFAQIWDTASAANDHFGLFGTNGLRFTFATPQNWIAVDYPGGIRFNLFSQGQLLYTSTFFAPGGLGNFAGLISIMSFDEVYLDKGPPFANSVFIDDLHWDAPVPAPSALMLFAAAAFGAQSRHRRR